MNSRNRLIALASAGGLAVTLAACGDDSNGGDTGANGSQDGTCGSVSASASHHLTGDSAVQISLEHLGEEVAANTDGRVTIDTFSDAQLGGLAEMTDNLRSGGIELALIDSGTLSQFDGELGLLDLPYLFENEERFNSVMDGEFGEQYNERAREVGVEPVFWSAVGARDMFFVDTEVRTPEDLNGVQMRVPEAPVWIDTFQALGASPAAVPASDLYTSLDTGVVEGFELPLGTTVDLNLHEPASVWSQTGHMMNSLLIAAAPSFIDSMCEEDLETFREAAESASNVMREEWAAANAEATDILTEALTVIDDVDLPAFEEAVQGVHEDFQQEHGSDLYERLAEQLNG